MQTKKTTTQPAEHHSCRHILSLSGGKDSTALALFMRDRLREIEYVFCDTEKELPETYQYLQKLEVYLGKKITRITPDISFDDLLTNRRNFLPSPQVRWCTEYLKIKPFEKYIGNDPVLMYIGIRADEPHRKGYISTKQNITPRFPFVEEGIRLPDVVRILDDSGLGLPDYYRWRSRSGCYFCFFQQRREWVGLLEFHQNLFDKAQRYERTDPLTGEKYTWVDGESLIDLALPERVKQIKEEYERRKATESRLMKDATLSTVFQADSGDVAPGCLICHL